MFAFRQDNSRNIAHYGSGREYDSDSEITSFSEVRMNWKPAEDPLVSMLAMRQQLMKKQAEDKIDERRRFEDMRQQDLRLEEEREERRALQLRREEDSKR